MFKKLIEKLNVMLFTRKFRKNMKRFIKRPQDFITIDDGKEPTEEEIVKYYKRYLMKKKDDDKSEWTTEKPYTYEEYREMAKKEGKHFLFGSVAVLFIMNPDNGRTTFYNLICERRKLC